MSELRLINKSKIVNEKWIEPNMGLKKDNKKYKQWQTTNDRTKNEMKE